MILDDVLHIAIITASPFSKRATPVATVERFADQRPDRLRSVLNALPRNAAVVLTLPSSMVALRPIALTSARWAEARAELEQSIARLLPFDNGDALLGLIDRVQPAPADAQPAPAAPDRSAYLLGCSRSAAAAIIGPLEEALGRPITRVQTIHHALLGLGLQRTPRAIIAEQPAHGSIVHHTLALGVIESLAEPASTTGEAPTHTLPGAPAPSPARPFAPIDIATAAAIAPRIAPGMFHPLAGRAPSPLRAWIAPAACIALAITLFLAAASITEARWSAGAESLDAGAQSRAADLARLDAVKADVERLHARLRAANDLTADWSSVFPDLAAAREVMPDVSIFHAITLTPASITISGEAPLASEVLQRIEASPEYSGAAMQGSAVPLTDRSGEQFTITARRESATPTPAPAKPRPEGGMR